MAKRIEAFFGVEIDDSLLLRAKPDKISKILDKIMEERFNGLGKWKNALTYRILASMIRRRPRDLVKLCHAAGCDAYRERSSIIKTENFQAIFDKYSQERLQDTVNEFMTELVGIDALILNMKPERKKRRTSEGFQFTNDELIVKIKNVLQNTSLSFTKNHPETARSIAQFLYKIDFISARKTTDDGKIDRKYFEQSRYLQNQFVEFGYHWEIHPADRWALQPGDGKDIFDSLGLFLVRFTHSRHA